MTLADVPVFRKDLRTLLKPMIGCVVLHWLYIAGVALIFWVNGWPNLMVAVSEAAAATQWMFGGAFGLVTPAYFLAEERTAGTLVFLRRLPVSRARIYAEKIGAALAALALLWICFAVSHALGAAGGLWPTEISEESTELPLAGPLFIGGVLALVSLSTYLVALPVALVVRQSSVIVLVGFAIWWAGFATFTLAVDAELSVSWDLVWVTVGVLTPLVAVPLVLALAGRRLRFNRAEPRRGRSRAVRAWPVSSGRASRKTRSFKPCASPFSAWP